VATLADEAFIFDSITIEVMVKPHRSPTKLAADGGLGDER
jgi:hypothetical protein